MGLLLLKQPDRLLTLSLKVGAEGLRREMKASGFSDEQIALAAMKLAMLASAINLSLCGACCTFMCRLLCGFHHSESRTSKWAKQAWAATQPTMRIRPICMVMAVTSQR
jgi:hypothetical protein